VCFSGIEQESLDRRLRMNSQAKWRQLAINVAAPLIGLTIFAVAEIGIARYVWAESNGDDMWPVAAIIFCAVASPFCAGAAIFVGLFARKRMNK
jgi:hypothetical protein